MMRDDEDLEQQASLKWGWEIRQRVIAALKRDESVARRLMAAQRRAKLTGETLWEALLGLSVVDEAWLADLFARETNLPRWTPSPDAPPDPAATALVPADFCRRQRLAPLRIELEQLVVAMADPSQRVALDRIELMTGRATRPLVGTFRDVSAALDHASGLDSTSPPLPRALLAALDEAVALPQRTRATAIPPESEPDAPITMLVSVILRRALERRVTQVVVEPVGHELRVLFRAASGLELEMTPPKKAEYAIVNRLKVLAGLDISERKAPQAGRVVLSIDGHTASPMQVRTIPTRDGEVVHLTCLRPDLVRGLDALGFEPADLAVYMEALARPGLILIAAPPGSGRRTLAYATLAHLARAGRSVVSVDEVTELELPGVLHLEHAGRAAAGVDEALAHAPSLLALDALAGDEVVRRVVAAVREGRTVLARAGGRDAASAFAAAGVSAPVRRALDEALALSVTPSLAPPASPGAGARGRYALAKGGAA